MLCGRYQVYYEQCFNMCAMSVNQDPADLDVAANYSEGLRRSGRVQWLSHRSYLLILSLKVAVKQSHKRFL